ncbi:MAG: antitoxin family protein [Planctomycetota bacterium]|nr:antitoxin family protein [Planctomycetota bacterium]
MRTVRAIYSSGVFRPVEPVDVPEESWVEFKPRLVKKGSRRSKALDGIYEVLSLRFKSGEKDVAARHEEHQP